MLVDGYRIRHSWVARHWLIGIITISNYTHSTGYKNLPVLNRFMLSMEPSFDAWLEAEMRLLHNALAATDGWLFEVCAVRRYVHYRVNKI